jgi:hypothetical protein
MIEEYKFGSITIDGKIYNHDVEVRWTGEVLKWRREEGHVFNVEDVKRAVEQNPDTIILGTGTYGVCKVTEQCQNYIKERGIELIIDKTEEAVKTFNIILEESKEEEGKQRKVIGLFHLTC